MFTRVTKKWNNIEDSLETLTNEELKKLIKSSTTDEEETEEDSAMWTLEQFSEIFQIAEILMKKIIRHDPVIEQSIKVTRMITEAPEPSK